MKQQSFYISVIVGLILTSCRFTSGYEFLQREQTVSDLRNKKQTKEKSTLTQDEAHSIAVKFYKQVYGGTGCGGLCFEAETSNEWLFAVIQGYAPKETGVLHVTKRFGYCHIQ